MLQVKYYTYHLTVKFSGCGNPHSFHPECYSIQGVPKLSFIPIYQPLICCQTHNCHCFCQDHNISYIPILPLEIFQHFSFNNTFNLFLLYIFYLRHILISSSWGNVFIILTTGGIECISSTSSRSVELLFSSNNIYLVKLLLTQA